MGLRDWITNLTKPKETSVPVQLTLETSEGEKSVGRMLREREIREIQIRINMLQEEAEVILRR